MKEPKIKLDPRMEELRDYILAKPGSEDSFPFGDQAMVFKVSGKIFALPAWEENPVYVSLKCDPGQAVELREQHTGIIPGYHLNKKHWNSVTVGGSIDLDLVHELIDHSNQLVVATLPVKIREGLS